MSINYSCSFCATATASPVVLCAKCAAKAVESAPSAPTNNKTQRYTKADIDKVHMACIWHDDIEVNNAWMRIRMALTTADSDYAVEGLEFVKALLTPRVLEEGMTNVACQAMLAHLNTLKT